MRYDPLFIACDVRCPSPEAASQVQELLRRETTPGAVMTVPVVSSEAASELSYRIGDYFEETLVLPDQDGDCQTFRLVFHRHPNAGRFWKDLMVRIIRSVEQAGPGISVTMVYRGDDYPKKVPVR
jgi:hypothetical protein